MDRRAVISALSLPPCLLTWFPPVGSTPSSIVREARWKIATTSQQLELFSDRTSTHTFQGNQLRLWFSSLAYVSNAVPAAELPDYHRASRCTGGNHPHSSAQVGGTGTHQCATHSDCHDSRAVPSKRSLPPPTVNFKPCPIRVEPTCICSHPFHFPSLLVYWSRLEFPHA